MNQSDLLDGTPEVQGLSQMCGILGKLTCWHPFKVKFKKYSRPFSSMFKGGAECSGRQTEHENVGGRTQYLLC